MSETYKLKSFLKLVTRPDEDKKLIQRRIIHLTTKRIVGYEYSGNGHGKNKYYTFGEIVELVIYLELMRHTVATETIREIISEYREEPRKGIRIEHQFSELTVDARQIRKYLSKKLADG